MKMTQKFQFLLQIRKTFEAPRPQEPEERNSEVPFEAKSVYRAAIHQQRMAEFAFNMRWQGRTKKTPAFSEDRIGHVWPSDNRCSQAIKIGLRRKRDLM